jgi:hypothetical protein
MPLGEPLPGDLGPTIAKAGDASTPNPGSAACCWLGRG